MTHTKTMLLGLTTGVLVTQLALPASAEGPSDRGGPSMAEFTKLQGEVHEQRQLILEMLQSEQQRYDMLLKLIRASTGAPLPDTVGALPGASGGPSAPGAAAVSDSSAGGRGRGGAESARRTASIEGRVAIAGGGSVADMYAYVENFKGGSVRGKSIEIRQENKQFSPRLAVVQVGTNVVFPNLDTVYHNVFSSSPRNSFDLGSYRGGDKARSVTLTAPGVVEIFCNMHQRMSANVLVVPGPLFARVRPDGSFRIDNVPLGARKVVVWSPTTRAAQQKIEVGTAGAQLAFDLERDDSKAHLNKLGQAYGSYRD